MFANTFQLSYPCIHYYFSGLTQKHTFPHKSALNHEATMLSTDPISLDLDPSVAARLPPLDDKLVLVLGSQEDLRGVWGAGDHDVNILWLLR